MIGQSESDTGANFEYPESYERCQMQEFLYSQIPADFQIFADTVSHYLVAPYSNPPSTLDNVLPTQNWLVRGAIREDDTGFVNAAPFPNHCASEYALSDQGLNPRSLNHFYDPVFDRALTLANTSGFVNNKATDWATGYTDSFSSSPQINTSRKNHYSYVDARNLFWNALTREANKPKNEKYVATYRESDAEDRMNSWATMFRSLGDVMHLLEDMGQPQHTRDDPHASFNSGEQQAFEDYTNDRVLGVTDELNEYDRGFFREITLPFSSPPLGSYPVPMFSTPVRYFSTRGDGGAQAIRAGLADYTNRGFFTGGTLPEVTAEPLPPHPLDTSYSLVVVFCPELSVADPRLKNVTCAHYTHPVPDVVAPQYIDELPPGFSQPPLFSASILLEIISASADGLITDYVPQTAIGIAELDTMGNMTIPRAVAYATGMLNFFFRGTLQVTAPSSGIYAIVNHGMPHTVDADGVPFLSDTPNKVFGFEKLRLQVKHTTQPIFDAGYKSNVPQKTGGGAAKMVAIARYHRNPCYQPDMSGERAQSPDGAITSTPNCSSFRTAYPEISVSAEVPVTTGMLDGQQPIEQEFDFSGDPIPINATDVFIQVAYRGPLGDETDGIAVGMVDVSEPTYDGDLAMTDLPLQYQEDGATWKWDPWTSPPWSTWTLQNGASWALPPPDPVADLAVSRVEICDNGTQLYLSAVNQQLPEDHSVRIATLRDFSTHTVSSEVTFQGQFAGPSSIGIYTRRKGGDVDQTDDEMGDGGTFTYQAYIRGVIAAPTYAYIYTCPTPLNVRSQCSVAEPPADNLVPSPLTQPAIPAPSGGFISENIGQVNTPGTVSCTIQGNYLPYAIRPRPAVTEHAASMSGQGYRSGQ